MGPGSEAEAGASSGVDGKLMLGGRTEVLRLSIGVLRGVILVDLRQLRGKESCWGSMFLRAFAVTRDVSMVWGREQAGSTAYRDAQGS